MRIIILLTVAIVAFQKTTNIHAENDYERPQCLPMSCPAIYRPVCGYDINGNSRYRNFPNDCIMAVFNCQHETKYIYLHSGYCTETDECPTGCPYNLRMICACNVAMCQTFANYCVFQKQTCGQIWTYHHEGKCRNNDKP